MTKDEALNKALEALRFALHVGFDESSERQIKQGDKASQQHRKAITAIKEALEQPEQEPVAWLRVLEDSVDMGQSLAPSRTYKTATATTYKAAMELPLGYYDLYTSPPKRKPLTDEEIYEICASLGMAQLSPIEVAIAIEEAHGIRE